MSTAMNEIASWNDRVQDLEDKLNKMKREMVEPFTELLVKLIKEELFDKYQVEKVDVCSSDLGLVNLVFRKRLVLSSAMKMLVIMKVAFCTTQVWKIYKKI